MEARKNTKISKSQHGGRRVGAGRKNEDPSKVARARATTHAQIQAVAAREGVSDVDSAAMLVKAGFLVYMKRKRLTTITYNRQNMQNRSGRPNEPPTMLIRLRVSTINQIEAVASTEGVNRVQAIEALVDVAYRAYLKKHQL